MKFIIVQLFTVARIPLAILFAILLISLEQRSITFSVTAIILVLNELTDIFDGMLARRLGIVSEWGAMLDPYADSISRLIIYWAFACTGLVIPLVPMAMAFRDVTVAYSRIILTRYNTSVSAKWSGKIKAGFQGIGAYVILLGPVYWPYTGKWTITVVSWIIIIVTLGSLIEYVRAALLAAWRSRSSDH